MATQIEDEKETKGSPATTRRGFTLVELAIVLVIVGIIISIVASVLPSLIESSKIKQTRALLEKADYALQGYSIANLRLPCADSDGDGNENAGVYAGTLPFRTLGLSSGNDIWGNPIKYAVYGAGAVSPFDLTRNFVDAAAFCAEITSASTAVFDDSIVHTTTASPCAGAGMADSSNQAYTLASGGQKDLDGANGFWDECNGPVAGVGFNIPGAIQSQTYDDLTRAYSLNELNQKNCNGSPGGGSGGGGENTFAGGCTNAPIDDDGDGLIDCADPDCATDPACVGGTPLAIITTAIAPGAVNSIYLTSFTASGGLAPYQWTLTNNGGFSDFSLNAFTGMLTGTLDQCPDSYTIAVQVQDSTPAGSGGPQTASRGFSLQVTSALTVSRTGGSAASITWSSPAQQETFASSGGRIGSIDWTLDSGGATGFGVVSTGAATCALRKTGASTAGTYTFNLTATDASCATNTATLVLDITVTAAGSGAPGGITGVIDTLEFDPGFGSNPDIIPISGDIYLVAYTGPRNNGFIRTVQIGTDGQITNSVIDSLEFNTWQATNPDVVHVSGDTYAITYTGPGNNGFITTVQIAADGSIANATIDTLEFDTDSCYEATILPISGDIFAIAYTGPGNDGYIKTVRIAGDGSITDSVVDTLRFNPRVGMELDVVHVSGDIYAMAYRGPGSDGFVDTVSIASDGQIGNAVIDSLEFDTVDAYNPDLIAVGGDIYAVAYEGPSSDGFVRTFQIASDGMVNASQIDYLEFDTVNGMEPVILDAGAGIFVIAYRGPGDDGFFSSIRIDGSGQISDTVLDSLEFEPYTATEPSMTMIGSGLFAVAYRAAGNDGFIATISMQ